MIVLCAWCQAEGQPARLGEKEPLADPRETHGICAAHLEQIKQDVKARHTKGASPCDS
mgnify:CR=1 FL=1